MYTSIKLSDLLGNADHLTIEEMVIHGYTFDQSTMDELTDLSFEVESKEELKAIVKAVNDAMLHNHMMEAVLSSDFLAYMARGTYRSKYIIKEVDGATVVDCIKVTKTVDTGRKDADGKAIKEARPAFLQYNEVMAFLTSHNKENKKKGLPEVKLNGDFNADQKKLAKITRHFMVGEAEKISEAQAEKLTGRYSADLARAFSDNSNDAIFAQVGYFYGILNGHTGKEFKPLKQVKKLMREDKRLAMFDSQTMQDLRHKITEVTILTVILNQYINTGVAIAKKQGESLEELMNSFGLDKTEAQPQ